MSTACHDQFVCSAPRQPRRERDSVHNCWVLGPFGDVQYTETVGLRIKTRVLLCLGIIQWFQVVKKQVLGFRAIEIIVQGFGISIRLLGTWTLRVLWLLGSNLGIGGGGLLRRGTATLDLSKLLTLRVQVPNNHILTSNLYYNYYYNNPNKYLISGYLDP